MNAKLVERKLSVFVNKLISYGFFLDILTLRLDQKSGTRIFDIFGPV